MCSASAWPTSLREYTRRRHSWCNLVAPDVFEAENSATLTKAVWLTPDVSTFRRSGPSGCMAGAKWFLAWWVLRWGRYMKAPSTSTVEGATDTSSYTSANKDCGFTESAYVSTIRFMAVTTRCFWSELLFFEVPNRRTGGNMLPTSRPE